MRRSESSSLSVEAFELEPRQRVPEAESINAPEMGGHKSRFLEVESSEEYVNDAEETRKQSGNQEPESIRSELSVDLMKPRSKERSSIERKASGSEASSGAATRSKREDSFPHPSRTTSRVSHIHPEAIRALSQISTVAPQAPYIVTNTRDKGKGLIATIKIHKGTRILAEAPLFQFTDTKHECSRGQMEQVVTDRLKPLSGSEVRQFAGLYNAYPLFGDLYGTAHSNAYPVGDAGGGEAWGVFLTLSRMNHDCKANAWHSWNSNMQNYTVHAMRDIESGEEITIMYCRDMAFRGLRRRWLREVGNFNCCCQTCWLPETMRDASDRRLVQVMRCLAIVDKIILGKVIYFKREQALHPLFRCKTLLLEEGLEAVALGKIYGMALKAMKMWHDTKRSKAFASLLRAHMCALEGEDSPSVIEANRMAEKPFRFRNFDGFKFWKPAEPPQGLSPVEFEEWLWRKPPRNADLEADATEPAQTT